ncbi:class I SAM-dependent methyltransferase [Paludifilum halophilum]|uniref:SAM-dependent methyltransferase n=1 Tax=Paludifilum halophilum TaxID=1642702 RepID=A0A235BB50_9BACL|nr:class I SAM-dependent methyltransferase [Paludifilum halophilum]OYD09538.1 hypothetical protein CHM34_00530 [Paludifilum halophilum]
MTVVTTSRKVRDEDRRLAAAIARRLNVSVVERDKRSLARLLADSGARDAVVVSGGSAWWQDRDGDEFFFHPGTAAIRLKQLTRGEPDGLVAAAGFRKGQRILDCTLGLASDAIVAAHMVGDSGEVIGLESQPVVAALVELGLETARFQSPRLMRAMRSVQVVCADYREFLPRCRTGEFDVILFDPMFRKTVQRSQSMQSLRVIANPDPLDEASVREAMRVAACRVVLKERKGSPEFERLGFCIVKEASTYALGVIDVSRRKGE